MARLAAIVARLVSSGSRSSGLRLRAVTADVALTTTVVASLHALFTRDAGSGALTLEVTGLVAVVAALGLQTEHQESTTSQPCQRGNRLDLHLSTKIHGIFKRRSCTGPAKQTENSQMRQPL